MINLKTSNWVIDNIDSVLFDKDGTIQDIHVYWGEIIKMRSIFLVNDLKLENNFFEKICLWMGYDLNKQKLLQVGPVGILSREEVVDKLVFDFKENNIDTSKEDILNLFDKVHKEFLKKIDNYVKILPGVRNLLINLKKKLVKVSIVTADNVDNARKCMELLELDQYIDQYVGRDHSTLPKTSGEHALIALELLGSKKENTVCFGDAPMDLIMAKNSGLKAGIGVVYGQTPRSELLKHSDYVLNSYDDLIIG